MRRRSGGLHCNTSEDLLKVSYLIHPVSKSSPVQYWTLLWWKEIINPYWPSVSWWSWRVQWRKPSAMQKKIKFRRSSALEFWLRLRKGETAEGREGTGSVGEINRENDKESGGGGANRIESTGGVQQNDETGVLGREGGKDNRFACKER